MKSKADEELEALSERFVQLGDEKTAWAAREAELLQQLQELQGQLQGQMQDQMHDQMQNGSFSPAPSPMPPSPQGDTHVKQQVYTNNVYNHVVVPNGANGGNGGWQHNPIDLGTDPNGDPGTEAVISQVQLSVRALCDMARNGNQKEKLLDNVWSELQAVKRLSGADCNGGWVAPVPGYYGEMVPMPQQQHWVPPPHYAGPRNVKRR
mgnify:FL=1